MRLEFFSSITCASKITILETIQIGQCFTESIQFDICHCPCEAPKQPPNHVNFHGIHRLQMDVVLERIVYVVLHTQTHTHTGVDMFACRQGTGMGVQMEQEFSARNTIRSRRILFLFLLRFELVKEKKSVCSLTLDGYLCEFDMAFSADLSIVIVRL